MDGVYLGENEFGFIINIISVVIKKNNKIKSIKFNQTCCILWFAFFR